MSVSPIILIVLSMGCGIFLGMIGLATAQAMRRADALDAHYKSQGE